MRYWINFSDKFWIFIAYNSHQKLYYINGFFESFHLIIY